MRRFIIYCISGMLVLNSVIISCSPSQEVVPVSIHIDLFPQQQNALHALSGSASTGNTALPTLTALQFHLSMYDLKITGTDFSPIHIITTAQGNTITALVMPGSNRYFYLTSIPDQLMLPQSYSGQSYPGYSYYYGFTRTDITSLPNQNVILPMSSVAQTDVTFNLLTPNGLPYTGSATIVLQDMDTGYVINGDESGYYYPSGLYPLVVPLGYDVTAYAIDKTNMTAGSVSFTPFTSSITSATITMYPTQTTSGTLSGSLWVGDGITPLVQNGLPVELYGSNYSVPTFSTTTDSLGTFSLPITSGDQYFEIVDPVTQNVLYSYSAPLVLRNKEQIHIKLPND